MVAITLGLVLTAAALSIFLSNRQSYEVTETLSRLQENARFGLDSMIRDLRAAGYFGCVPNGVGSVGVAAPLPSVGVLWNATTALEGIEEPEAGDRWPSDTDASVDLPASIQAESDAVTVRYLLGPGAPITSDASVTKIQVSDTVVFEKGQILAIADCGFAVVFQLASDPAPLGAGNAELAVRVVAPMNGLGRTYEDLGPTLADPDADRRFPAVMPLRAVRYYIREAEGETPALWRQIYTWDPDGSLDDLATAEQEVAAGVERMRLLYGLDTSGDSVPDSYVRASGVAADQWAQVVAVRLGLLLRTTESQAGTAPVDANTYDLFSGATGCDDGDGCVDPPDLPVRRRVFTTAIALRNAP
jgi:type IV pilus assembly protein PilW